MRIVQDDSRIAAQRFKKDIQTFAESFDRPDFSAAILKWSPLIENTVYQLAKITKQDIEDVRQNLLLDLASVANYFSSPLYRYKNRIWQVKQESGRLALIESPKHIIRRMEPRWLYKSRLTPVKKSSASSFVYRIIIQHLPDAATKHFRQKNGYTLVKTKRNVIEKAGKTRKLQERDVFVPVRTQRRADVDLSSLLDFSAIGFNPEDICLANRLLEDTSAPTQKIAKMLLTSGLAADKVMGRRAKLGARQVAQAKVELIRRLKRRKYPAGYTPVHFSAEQML